MQAKQLSRYEFPPDFFWGAATAAYQVEGGIYTTDWAKAALEGRVPECGDACDHYNRYEADFDLVASMGHNAHRLSVEWARIEPEEGVFDDDAMVHYVSVTEALQKRGIHPSVTLWHFTLPTWFSESGGFERADAPEIFARYCTYVVQHLKDHCHHYATMNEPIVFATNGWFRGTWPPFKRFVLFDALTITNSGRQHEARFKRGVFAPLFLYFRVVRNLIRAHIAAYKAIKHVHLASDVSLVKHIIFFHANGNIFNRTLARFMNWWWTHRFMKRVVAHCDSIGINYYFHRKFGDTATYQKTDMDWDIYPQGIYGCIMMLTRYQKPLYVAESGIADAIDDRRGSYITEQVYGVWRAIQDGADVRGHFYWSLMDNYEWALGFEKRFGLIEIDYTTQKRTIRPSAHIYERICRDNAVYY